MTKKSIDKIRNLIQENFWGIFYSSIALISFILILSLGIGNFILLLLIVLITFIVGNSKDKGKSIIQTINEYIDKINNFIKNLKI
ncbi:MAG: hypothetical protein ACP5PT_02215 [Brevinematia bacterium]|jgi:hypothetical protein